MSGMIQKVESVPGGTVSEAPQVPVAAENNGTLQDPMWYWEDGKPGDGDRPEWLEAKYTKVTDQAKAYKELEKKLGGQNNAPDEYDVTNFIDKIDFENEHIGNLRNKAKELKLSQDAFNDLLDPLVKYHESLAPNVDEEIAKLGDNAKMKINTVNTWASNHLSEKSLDTLGKISHTADVVELIDEIRQLHHQTVSRVPTSQQATAQKAVIITPQQVQDEIILNYDRYQKDGAFRAEMSRKMAQAVGED